MRILALAPESVGDFLLTVPSLAALEKHFPEAEIYWRVPEPALEAADLVPLKARRQSRNHPIPEKLDVTVCFPPAVKYIWEAFKSGGKKRIGYAHQKMLVSRAMARICLSDYWICPADSPVHELEAYAKTLEFLGIQGIDPFPFLQVPEIEMKEASRWLESRGIFGNSRIVAIQLNDRWPENPLKRMKPWLEKKLETRCLALFGPGEEAIARKCLAGGGIENILVPGVISFAKYAAFLKASSLLVSPDGGPVHIASAVKIPAMVFYSKKNRKQMEKKWHPCGVAYRAFSFFDLGFFDSLEEMLSPAGEPA